MFKLSAKLLLLTLTVAACGVQKSSNSLIKGHFENASASDLDAYRGQQMIPAEYQPTLGVVVSRELVSEYRHEDLIKAILDTGVQKVWITTPRGAGESLYSRTYNELREQVGASISRIELLTLPDAGYQTVWARDWSPLGAIDRTGKLRLLDLNYYPSRPADDSSSQALAEDLGVPRLSLPLYNEGGNFMTNRQGRCLTTTRVTDANSDVFVTGDQILDATEVTQLYKEFGGCQELHILPRMPLERTGHIDMWAKFLDDRTIIVNELRDATLASTQSESARNFAATIRTYLDDRARDLSTLGFRVLRIPMPLPRPGHFRSYTNSLVVNGTALIPQYRERHPDSALLDEYEAEVLAVYQASGFKPVFIPSDDLIDSGGAVHCVTMQIPAAL